MRKSWMLLVALLAVGCGGIHGITVTVVGTKGALAMIQDTETTLVCGRPTAPAAPQCVPLETHHVISAKLAQAFDLEGRVAQLVHDAPVGSPQPADVPRLLSDVSSLISSILASLPQSQAKATLVQNIGGTK